MAQAGPFHTAASFCQDTAEVSSTAVGAKTTSVFFGERVNVCSKTLPFMLHSGTLDLEVRGCLPPQCQSHREFFCFVLPGMLLPHGLALTRQGNLTQVMSFGVLLWHLLFETKSSKFLEEEEV